MQVHTALGRLVLPADNREVAGSHFREALQSYTAALRAPEALGTLRDRSDIRSALWTSLPAGQPCVGWTRSIAESGAEAA